MGSWSFIGDAKDVTNLEEAVKAQADTTNMSFHAGSPMLGSDIRLEGFGEAMEQSHTPEEEETMLLEAVNAAKEADVVVLAIGEDRLQSGEATSNANIRIPEIQQRLLERVSKVNENIVVVLFNGRPLDLRDVVSKAKAVLEVWMPGTEGANAIADVVFGAYAPSGRLTMSFPYSVCLLYTSDAADDLLCVDLGGRRITKKKNIKKKRWTQWKKQTKEVMTYKYNE